ncbi:hypothetical protein LJ739_09965 [Aestuariibacter halophilus]|uniref:Solute-binding protein family 3/N-terminal domain-containing protein n=1 Tax=Fluctibacter halophilus TaxID=226011 RepID=A0ABS8G8Z4_9ALTE|nr:hypothetical protein [Aestuariibacter halophilus]MCC2616566.1 hypothetical protein [Aestuariibacter halophilus]
MGRWASLMQRWGIAMLLGMTAVVQAQPSVLWLSSKFPPCHMPGAPDKQGYCDKAQALIQQRLPEYTHRQQYASLQRIQQLMKTDEQFCTLTLLHSPERANYMHFSRPILGIIANGFIARADDPRLPGIMLDEQRVSLSDALQQNWLIGVNKKRVYGAHIDGLLAANSDGVVGIDGERQSIPLLLAKRFDGTIGSAAELGWHMHNNGQSQRLRFFLIDQSAALLHPAVSCRNSVLGREIIQRLNERITAQDQAAFVRFYVDWLPAQWQQHYDTLVSEGPR